MDWNTIGQVVVTIIGWEAMRSFWNALFISTLYRFGNDGLEIIKFDRKNKNTEKLLKAQGFLEFKELKK